MDTATTICMPFLCVYSDTVDEVDEYEVILTVPPSHDERRELNIIYHQCGRMLFFANNSLNFFG